MDLFIVTRKNCRKFKIGETIKLSPSQATSLVGKIRLKADFERESEIADGMKALREENTSLADENKALKKEVKKLKKAAVADAKK